MQIKYEEAYDPFAEPRKVLQISIVNRVSEWQDKIPWAVVGEIMESVSDEDIAKYCTSTEDVHDYSRRLLLMRGYDVLLFLKERLDAIELQAKSA